MWPAFLSRRTTLAASASISSWGMPIALRLTYRPSVGNEATTIYRDAAGRSVPVPAAARVRRVVSLVPSLTEVVAALGAADRLVGVTRYCPGLAPVVGGTKQVDLQMIIELAPDLVLANQEENLERDVRKLAEAGLAVYVTYPRTLEQGLGVFAELGRLLGCEAAAAREEARCRAVVDRVRAAVAGRPARRAACLVWREPLVAVGDDSYGGDVMKQLGLLNVCRDLGGERRYPFVDEATLRAAAPELVLLPDEPYAWTASERDELGRALGAKVAAVDGSLLFWYGPRIARLHELADALATALRAEP